MKSKKLRRALIITLVAALTLAAAVIGFGLYLMNEFDSNRGIIAGAITKTASPTPSASASPRATYAAQNILVMGSDTRGSLGTDLKVQGNRSDTMLLVHIEADREHVQIISLPRDTWVPIKGFNKGKINWAMSYGGAPLAVDTVERFLHIHIDHLAMIDFNGAIELSNVLNGIWLDNPRAFTNGRDAYKTIYHFKKGRIKLKGGQALAFVRERHAFAGGDGDRVKNQQLFARGVIERLLNADVLTNPATLVKFTRKISELLLVDEGLNSKWITQTAIEMRNFKIENLRTFTLPLKATGHVGQHYVLFTSSKEIKKLSDAFANDTLDTYVLPAEIKTEN